MDIKGTTIVAVQKDGKCALAGDGQVTLGEATIMKHTARKVRRIYNDSVVVGFVRRKFAPCGCCACSGLAQR